MLELIDMVNTVQVEVFILTFEAEMDSFQRFSHSIVSSNSLCPLLKLNRLLATDLLDFGNLHSDCIVSHSIGVKFNFFA